MALHNSLQFKSGFQPDYLLYSAPKMCSTEKQRDLTRKILEVEVLCQKFTMAMELAEKN